MLSHRCSRRVLSSEFHSSLGCAGITGGTGLSGATGVTGDFNLKGWLHMLNVGAKTYL